MYILLRIFKIHTVYTKNLRLKRIYLRPQIHIRRKKADFYTGLVLIHLTPLLPKWTFRPLRFRRLNEFSLHCVCNTGMAHYTGFAFLVQHFFQRSHSLFMVYESSVASSIHSTMSSSTYSFSGGCWRIFAVQIYGRKGRQRHNHNGIKLNFNGAF